MKRINRDILYICLIILIGFLSFHNYLDNYFIASDDFHFLAVMSGPESFFYKIFTLEVANYVIPLPSFVILIFFKLFTFNPFWFIFGGICFHIINAILVYHLSKFVIRNRFFSFVSSLFFLVFRHTSQMVSGMSPYDHLFVVMFYLLSLIFFIKYINTTRKMDFWLWLVFFISAFFSKEQAVLLIFIYILYELCFSDFRFRKEKLTKYIPFVVITFIYLILQFMIQKNTFRTGSYYSFGYHAIINILNYIIGLLFPFNQFIHAFFKDFSHSSTNLVLSFLVIFITIILFIKGSKKTKFLVFWIYITLVPASFFNGAIVPRFSYISLIGYSMLLSLFLFYVYVKLKRINKALMDIIISIIIVTIVLANVFLVNIDEKEYAFLGEESRTIILDLNNVKNIFNNDTAIFFVDHSLDCYDLKKGIEVFHDVSNFSLICSFNHLNYLNKSLEDVTIIEYINGSIKQINN